MPKGVYKRTIEHIRNATEARRGYHHSEETKRKIGAGNIGKHRTDEVKSRLSLLSMGNKNSLGSKNMLGKHHSEESRRKIGLAHAGDKNANWRGGISSLENRVRHSLEYKLWREKVLQRDGYKCSVCGEQRRVFHVHHIQPFMVFPDLRFSHNNGITYCPSCHRKHDMRMRHQQGHGVS